MVFLVQLTVCYMIGILFSGNERLFSFGANAPSGCYYVCLYIREKETALVWITAAAYYVTQCHTR